MKREADGSAMGGGGPTNPNKRYRHGDDELRLLIPSKVATKSNSLPVLENCFVYCFYAWIIKCKSNFRIFEVELKLLIIILLTFVLK